MTVAIVLSIIAVSAIKILITCLPTPVVKWLLNRFATHPELNAEHTIVTVDGKTLEGENKENIINSFNRGTFLESYYVHAGNQESFLRPEHNKKPIVIEATIGKQHVKLHVYSFNDHVDVVKSYKKKIIAYSMLSDNLQNSSV